MKTNIKHEKESIENNKEIIKEIKKLLKDLEGYKGKTINRTFYKITNRIEKGTYGEWIAGEITTKKNYFGELEYSIYFNKNGKSYTVHPETRVKQDVIGSLEKLWDQIEKNIKYEKENIKEIKEIQDKEEEIIEEILKTFKKYGIQKQKEYILTRLRYTV